MISHPDESFKVTLGVFTLNPYREMESCLRFWPKENKDTWDNEFSWGFTLGLVNFSKNKFFFAFQDFFFFRKKNVRFAGVHDCYWKLWTEKFLNWFYSKISHNPFSQQEVSMMIRALSF